MNSPLLPKNTTVGFSVYFLEFGCSSNTEIGVVLLNCSFIPHDSLSRDWLCLPLRYMPSPSLSNLSFVMRLEV